nr:leucine-rich repeat extensin-like protein 5 [Quercus suber]
MEFLGFTPANDNKTLVGQRILISRLVEAIAAPLPDDATEIQIHKYARCYILVLLGDKLFMDKSGDRVHLMFLEQLRNFHDPPQLCGSHTRHTSSTFLTSGCKEGYMDSKGVACSREHNYVRRILYNVAGLRADPAATGQANNRTETKLATTAALVISTAPVTTPTHGRHDTASPSTSAARGSGQPATVSPSTSAARGRGRPATVSPSISAARGRGRPATASPSTSATRGRGRCATTVPEVLPSIPVASPQSEVPPPMVDVSPQAEVPSPTPPSQPSPLTPPMHPETPLYPATSSNALTLPMDPPRTEPMTMIPTPGLYIEHHYPLTSSSSDPLGPPVGIDMLQSDIDVSDEHPPHQPSPPRGRPQRARRAPICGTGGHKIGHKGSSMHDDEPKADAPQPPPSPKHYTRGVIGLVFGNENSGSNEDK